MQEGKESKMSKSTSNSNERPNAGRRSFIWKAGAAASAVLAASVPAMSMPNAGRNNGLKGEVDRLSAKLESLEDQNEIRELNRAFESFLDNGRYENVVELFSADGEVIFNGGIFKGKDKGVRRLFCEYFSAGETGKKVVPAPGFEHENELLQESVEISMDRGAASGRFPFSIQVGMPIVSDSVLVKMARLQGGGIMKWWEGGVYEMSYVKDDGDSRWKIKSIDFQTVVKADYRPGRSYAKQIDIPLFSKVYPDDPSGPDRLSRSARRSEKA